jgi:hypothetical protein
MMGPGRIAAQHMVDQAWQNLRDNQEDIERIFKEGTQPGDGLIVRAAIGYVLAQMTITDYDLEEAE